jgi:HAD superfamily hydrolase (TIGR01509 family)
VALRAVIFDFDGVLVNSEPLHFRAMRESLIPEGIVIDSTEYLRHYVAFDDRGAIRLALEQHGHPSDAVRVEIVADRKARMFAEMKSEVPFFPGARELVRELRREAVPLGIASGARCSEIEGLLEAGGLRDAFAAVVGADNVERTKPHPDPYLEALRRLRQAAPGLEAGDCLAIEDTPPGIAAARAAGMTVVGVAHTYDASVLASADHVLPSLRRVNAAELRALAARRA